MKNCLIDLIKAIFLFAMLVGVLLIAQPAYAQKYKKHKAFNKKKFAWWEVKYPDGTVGISIGKKKNVIAGRARGYSAVKYDNFKKVFVVNNNEYVGFVDEQGKEMLAPDTYKYASIYIENDSVMFYKVTKDVDGSLKTGVLNSSCKEIMPCVYSDLSICKRTVAEYKGKYKVGYYIEVTHKDKDREYISIYDDAGSLVLPFVDCDYIDVSFVNDYNSDDLISRIISINVSKDKKYGVYDKEGNLVVPIIYDYAAGDGMNGILRIKVEKNYGA